MSQWNNEPRNSGQNPYESQNNMAQIQPEKGKPQKNRLCAIGIKIAAIICMAMFFFPLFTVSCSVYGETYSEGISGWNCTQGMEVFDGEGTVESHPLNSLLLIIPAGLLAIAVFLRSKVNPAAILLGIAQVVALLIFRSSVIEYVQVEVGSMVNVSFTMWYTIDVLSAIAAAVLGAIGMVNLSHIMNTDQIRQRNNDRNRI